MTLDPTPVPPRPRRTRTGVAGCLLALALSGCGASEQPVGFISSPSSGVADPVAAGTGETLGGPQDVTALGWRGIQAPHRRSVVVSSDPGAPPLDPATPVIRADLAPGASATNEYVGRRAEVYGRVAPSWSDDPAAWPDPPGSVRWFTYSVLLPEGFPTSEDTAQWLVLTQWKGRDGGSPPLALEVQGDHLRLGGSRTNAGQVPNDGDLGALTPGRWTTLSVGIGFGAQSEADGGTGWVQVLRDGVEAVPRTPVATMDVLDGAVDPVYLKQGIYRSATWTVPQTAYFSTVAVTDAPPG